MIIKKYNLKKSNVTVTLDKNYFYVGLNNQTYYAKYDFNIENIPTHHVDLMIYYIFYGFGENKVAQVKTHTYNFGELSPTLGNKYVEVEIPPYEEDNQIIDNPTLHPNPLFPPQGDNKIIMYSGGYDSTAVKVLFPEAPAIYLHRDYNEQYAANQQKALKLAKAHIVTNNIEQLRTQYVPGRPGFNTGNGYTSLLIPYLTKYKANEILCGAVFDDVAFNHNKSSGKVSMPGVSGTGRSLNSMFWTKRAGINLSYSIAGLSEVWTSKLVNDSKYTSAASSCHTKIEKNYCGKCYKCLRKLPIINKADQVQSEAIILGKKAFQTKPLKMAVSTVYGVQKLNNELSNVVNKIDVSFLDRYSEWHTALFSNPNTLQIMKEKYAQHNILPMESKDYQKLNIALNQINNIQY